MRADLVEILCCPETRAPLELEQEIRFFERGGRRFVVDGVLRARDGSAAGGLRYPIVDEIPRLVPRRMLHEEEIDFLVRHRAPEPGVLMEPQRVTPPDVTPDDLVRAIRDRMEGLYQLPPKAESEPHDGTSSETLATRRRCEGEIRYMTAEARGDNKRKYLPLLAPRVDRVDSLLEVGGNFPGLARMIAERSREAGKEPDRVVVANLQILFPQAFRSANRSIDAVRADVQALPFRDGAFDLAVSAFMLEHVPDWRTATAELLRAADRTFLAFGPNRHFPFEVGHVDAPLAGSLPAPWDARAAWLWLRLLGRPRPLHRLEAILSEVFHVSSREFEHHARALGAATQGLFPELVDSILADRDAPPTPARRALRAAPAPARLAARVLARLRLEPQIYYWLEAQR